MFGMGIAVHQDRDLVYSLLDAAQVADPEGLYDPARHTSGRGSERQADTDVAMFGFDVMNNVGIGFRTFFAGGLLLGFGSIVILLFNGLSIDAVVGYLTRVNYGHQPPARPRAGSDPGSGCRLRTTHLAAHAR